MRQKVMVPTNGSSMILKASSAIGSLSDGLRSTSLPLRSTPFTAGTSSGEGRKSTTASRSGCTPLFLNAEPHRKESARDRRFANEPLESGDVGFFAFEIGGHRIVIELDRSFHELLAI